MLNPKLLYQLYVADGKPANCWSGSFTSCHIVFIGDEYKFGFQLAVAYNTAFAYIRGWWGANFGTWKEITLT